jgi:hypothetical protein
MTVMARSEHGQKTSQSRRLYTPVIIEQTQPELVVMLVREFADICALSE